MTEPSEVKGLIDILEKYTDEIIILRNNPYIDIITQQQQENNILHQAIKSITNLYTSKHLRTCDVCFTSSWAPSTKDTPYSQQVKGKDEWVLCQMCEADRQLYGYRKDYNELKAKLSQEKLEALISDTAVEVNTKNITPSFIWKCSLKELATAIRRSCGVEGGTK